ncbi:MATE family efflux transporter [Congregibacter variabilis]|uniref:MATE family efflux transporter n=1 Tax=Congregibacter variabilis TaxID=3081200 RepID=A0ABZ0I0B8_9GAMM|nr:MATE family efflux transporter [Congregibacter sp. IMCC43200]
MHRDKPQHIAMPKELDAKIWAIAWPAIIANISIPLLGLVDAALLGHLDSPTHLAAVAVGGAVLSFLYWGFSFLRMGTTGEVARANGAGDVTRALLALARSALIALSLAALLLLFQGPLLALGFAIMGTRAEIQIPADNYASLRLLSAPAVLLTYTAVGWFIGHQDTRWPMRILIITNLINIVLDALFILGLGLASTGAAIATVIAEYVGLVIAIIGLRKQWISLFSSALWAQLRELKPYLHLLHNNLNLFFRTLTLLFAFAFFTAAGESLGPEVVAANAVMMQFLLFAAFAMDGFAYAAEGLAGEALGSGNTKRFFAVSRRCALWTGVSAFVISAIILLGKPWLFPLLTGLPEVLRIMSAQSLWLVALPLIAAPSYLLDGLFIGAGATRAMMLSMLFSALVVYLPCYYASTALGNQGLWLSFALFNASRGITLAVSFVYFTRQRRWQHWSQDQAT